MNVENIRALARKLRRIRHEEHYNQGRWMQRTACGTSACIAGHAAAMAGYRPVRRPDVGEGPYETIEPDSPMPVVVCAERPKAKRKLSEVAREWLGLTHSQESALFSEFPDVDWPEPFAQRFDAAKHGAVIEGNNGVERPSRVAADLLDAIAAREVKLKRNARGGW